jgi:hypothetical protein
VCACRAVLWLAIVAILWVLKARPQKDKNDVCHEF